jgi:hypothetical protein
MPPKTLLNFVSNQKNFFFFFNQNRKNTFTTITQDDKLDFSNHVKVLYCQSTPLRSYYFPTIIEIATIGMFSFRSIPYAKTASCMVHIWNELTLLLNIIWKPRQSIPILYCQDKILSFLLLISYFCEKWIDSA